MPVTKDQFNAFCGKLPGSTHVVQWGGSEVWKVGGKVFALGGWETGMAAITFKVSEAGYEMLSQQPGLRPAPYLASRGLKWVQVYAKPGLTDQDLKAYLMRSYGMITDRLPRKTRAALGLIVA